jgi:ABC-type proline/glycine betaine transport system permease subunit
VFGAGRMTILFLIKLPLAFRIIMAGKCVMMSMVINRLNDRRKGTGR